MDVVKIARTCRDANRAWCEANGDLSQKSWEKAAAWQQESAILGVTFVIDNPDALDSALHDAWCLEKTNPGWTHGEVKDETFKTHPCLVPFSKLPPHQQAKDRLFRAIVKAIAQ